jgi:hypothetical protein
VLGDGVPDRAGDRVLHALPVARWSECRRHREAPAGAGDDGGITKQRRHPGAVDGGGHHQQAEVGAKQGLRVEREGEAGVAVHRPFVELVEEHGTDAVQGGVIQQHPGQHPFGHDLDAGLAADARIAAHPPPDQAPDGRPEERRHATGRRPGRKPAGLQQEDPLVAEPGGRP